MIFVMFSCKSFPVVIFLSNREYLTVFSRLFSIIPAPAPPFYISPILHTPHFTYPPFYIPPFYITPILHTPHFTYPPFYISSILHILTPSRLLDSGYFPNLFSSWINKHFRAAALRCRYCRHSQRSERCYIYSMRRSITQIVLYYQSVSESC